jgi:MFS family permease
MIATRAFMGLSEAFYMPAGLALVAALHSERSRSLATALHQSGNYIGIVIGGVLGGWFAEHVGWRYGFFVLGAAGVLYALLLRLAFGRVLVGNEETKPQAHNLLELAAELRGLRGFRAMLAVFCLFAAAGWVVITWMPLYLYERFGMSLTEAGFAATFYQYLGAFVGIFGGGWLSDRLSSRSPWFLVYLPAGGFLCSALFLFTAASTASPAVLFLALTMFGFGRGLYDCNVMPLLCLIASPRLRAAGYGIFNSGGCLAGGVMTALAGWLKSTVGLAGAMQWSALGLLIAGGILGLRVARVIMEQTAPDVPKTLHSRTRA